jgi:predicted secreted protein
MTITAAIVLFAVAWFMVFFCVLPIRFQSQQDLGAVTPGTPKSAPQDAMIAKKAQYTTAIAAVLWLILYLVITSGMITTTNMDVFGIMGMVPPVQTPAQP